MRTKLTAILLTIALMLVFPLAGCQTNSSTTGDNLTVWIKNTDYRDYVKDVFELYQEETDNKLEVKIIDDDEFSKEVVKAFQNGSAPDVLMCYNDSDLEKIGVEENFLVLNDQAWADSLMSGARSYCDDGNGNLIGLPFWESSVSGCYYNKTVLSQLGLKPASTQAEFDMLCQAIKSVGYTPLFWGDECGWMYQFGLDPIFADDPTLLQKLNSGEINYVDIPQVLEMVQWIYNAYEKGWLGDPKNKSYEDVSESVASGEAIMVDIWDTWFATDFVAGKYRASDFAVMPIFMGTSEDGTYEGGNLNMMLVNKNAKHLDEAIGFLEFCAQPEIYNKVFYNVPSAKVFTDQNTIITSDMVVNASDSISKLERVSTASPKILGYSQEDMTLAFNALFNGEVTVEGCVAMMDDLRKASIQGEN